MRPCTARGWSHWPDTAAKQLTCVHGASVRSGFEVWLQQLFLSAARKVSQVGVGDIQSAIQDGQTLAGFGFGDGARRYDMDAIEIRKRQQPRLFAGGERRVHRRAAGAVGCQRFSSVGIGARRDIELLYGEPLYAASEPGPHLVGDHRDAVAITQLLHAWDGLQYDRRNCRRPLEPDHLVEVG